MSEARTPSEGSRQSPQEKKTGNLPKVLIFEDEASVERLLRMTLSGKANIVGSFDKAEAWFVQSEQGEYDIPEESDVDVVITDLGLQGMNGIEAAKIIKKGHEKRGKLPPHMVMVSGSGDSEIVQQQGRDVGITDYFSKPFSPRALQEKLQTGFDKLQQERSTQQ